MRKYEKVERYIPVICPGRQIKGEIGKEEIDLISFDQFEREDGIPIYLQIVRYIKWGISAGTIKNGDPMPSRRALSALLGVNPNTIQKAYRLLEEEGLLSSRHGAKSCISIEEEMEDQVRSGLMEQDIKNIITTLKNVGMTKEAAIEMIEKYWEE